MFLQSARIGHYKSLGEVFPDIAADCRFPTDPEQIRNAKGWLSNARPTGSACKPTQHQARLAAQVDLGRLRRRSPSFNRFESAVRSLLS